MTRRDFTRLRRLAALGALPIAALVGLMLYFALSARWAQLRNQPAVVPTSATLAPTVPAPLTLAPTLTPTSIWGARLAQPTAIPQATAQPVTTTTVGVERNIAADAHVRFVHAAAEAQPMDVYVNGVKLFAARSYMSVSPYVGLPEGIYTVHATAHGETQTLWRKVIRLDARNDYSLIALQGMHAELLTDDNTLPDYGQVRLRAVHVSTQLPKTESLRFDDKKRLLMIDDGSSNQSGGYAAIPDTGVAIHLLQGTRKRVMPEQKWQMGMVYTLWIFSTGSTPQVGLSEDAFKLYLLLPETGGDGNGQAFLRPIGKSRLQPKNSAGIGQAGFVEIVDVE